MLNKNSKYKSRHTYSFETQLNKKSLYRSRDPDVIYPRKYLHTLEWLQNPKTVLEEFYTVYWQENQDYTTAKEHRIYFRSDHNDSILNNSKVLEKNSFIPGGKDYYISRGKDTCTVVMGDGWTAGDKMWVDNKLQIDLENNDDALDFRLENVYGGVLAKNIHSDLYLSAPTNEPSNTDNVFGLIAILDYLQAKKYREINVVFQFNSAEQDMNHSNVWANKYLTGRYGQWYKTEKVEDTIRTSSNLPTRATPWAYFFWHMGARRTEVYANGWHIMDFWPFGFMKYEEWFQYYDLCILELLDAVTDKWINVNTVVFKRDGYFKEWEFGQLKVIEKPWLKTILEKQGQNIDLVPAYSDDWISTFSELFICNPFKVDHDELMLLREDGFLQDIITKSRYINKALEKTNDKNYFANMHPQIDCHNDLAWYLIDKAKWKV